MPSDPSNCAVRDRWRAAETEQAELVGLGEADGGIGDDTLRQPQLGRGEIEIGALRFRGADRAQYGAALGDPILHARGDLRQRRVLVPHRVADDPDLGSDDMLAEGEAPPETERRTCRARIETLIGVGEFDPVRKADRTACAGEVEVGERDIGRVHRAAVAILRLVAGDHRPTGETAAGRALDRGNAVGEQQLAACAALVRLRGRGGADDREQQGAKRSDASGHAAAVRRSW